MNKAQSSRLNLAILLNAGLAFMFLAFWLNALRSGITWQADFTAYYTGWRMIMQGDSRQLYDLATQTRYQQAILAGKPPFADGLLPFVNPPHLSWQTAPLGLLPLNIAYLLWALLNLVMLAFSLRELLKLVAGWSAPAKFALVAAVCGFYPIYTTFLLGSFPLLMLLCLLLIFRDSIAENYKRAGLWLLVASMKFQLIVFVGVWLLATRRWRVILWATIYGIGLAIITSLILGWQTWGDYLKLLSFHSKSFDRFGIYPSDAYTLKGTLTLLFGRNYADLINLIAQGTFVVMAIGLFWLFWRNPSRHHAHAGWQYGLAILLNLLFSLHLNHHDALLLVIPALFSVLWMQRHANLSRHFVIFVLSCPLLFFVTDLTIGKQLGIQIPVLLMLALLIWMIKDHSLKTTHH